MKIRDFSELSVEELQRKEKMFKVFVIMSAALFTLTVSYNVFMAINKGTNLDFLNPLGLICIALVNWRFVKKIQEELGKRKMA
ncbi:MAG: hypothetical protein U0Y10_22235 [Spirosomataceae bacterium]